MINFFRRWLFNRSRFVFRYWNGHRITVADPMVLWRSLQQNEDFREEDFKLMKIDSLRDNLIGKVAGVVRQVFSLKTPEEAGLTELECLDLLKAFMAYSGFQKKSGDLMQTSQPPMEATVLEDSTPDPSTNDVSESI